MLLFTAGNPSTSGDDARGECKLVAALLYIICVSLKVKPIPEPESIPENKSGPNSTVTAPENENISLPEKPKDIEENKAEDGRSWCSC